MDENLTVRMIRISAQPIPKNPVQRTKSQNPKSLDKKKEDMKEKEFKIHAYGKSELAMLYFPGDNKELALKKLRCWLAKNKKLRHFVSREKKYFTPKQVKIIIEELGEPDD